MLAVGWRGVVAIVLSAGAGLLLLRSATGERESGDSRSYNDSDRYVPKRRPLDDLRVGRVSGTITHEGRPVRGASIEALVHPIGHHGATVDRATSGADGAFSMPITAGNLDRKQPVSLAVELSGMHGRAMLMLAPGEKAANVRVEVGAGVTVRGRVTGAGGAAPGHYDMRELGVCLGNDCGVVRDDGSFELTALELGRNRFEVIGGGVTTSAKEMPMTSVAPHLEVDRLSGVIGPILLQVDEPAAVRSFNAPDWSSSAAGGTTRVRVATARGTALPKSIMCMTNHGGEDVAVGDGRKPVVVPVLRYGNRSRIECEADDSLRVGIYDPPPGGVIDLPIVIPTIDDIDLGAELRSDAKGARVLDVTDEARKAGLQPNDIVTAVDGISVANTNARVVRALGFRLAPGESTKLTVLRGDAQVSITLRAPAAAR